MKQLQQDELSQVSGASTGTFYLNGQAFVFECDGVSQECLDTYLRYFNGNPPGVTTPQPTSGEVSNVCGGLGAIDLISAALEPVYVDIRSTYIS